MSAAPVAPLAPGNPGTQRLPSAARAHSRVSLNRTTEQEGIVVDEGYCEVLDSSFAEAADRLALLECEQLSESSGPNSTRSLGGVSQAHATSQSSDSSSAKPQASERLPAHSSSSLKPRTATAAVSVPAASKKMEPALSVRSSGNLPPGSPFGQADVQTSTFHDLSGEDAEAKLKSMHLNKRLLSGLQSLSMDELSVYMQLTEELRREGVGQPPGNSIAAKHTSAGTPLGAPALNGSHEDRERLDSAVRQLKALLPASAIEQLQSHASYGLMDVIHSQPLTPPPTPTSPHALGDN